MLVAYRSAQAQQPEVLRADTRPGRRRCRLAAAAEFSALVRTTAEAAAEAGPAVRPAAPAVPDGRRGNRERSIRQGGDRSGSGGGHYKGSCRPEQGGGECSPAVVGILRWVELHLKQPMRDS